MPSNNSIGFIGLGVMGKSMAQNLMNAGYQLNIYTRTKEKGQSLLDKGAKWRETPKDVAEHSSIVITMVGYPSDVEVIYFGEDGILQGAKKGSYLIDMTTSTPTLAQKIYGQAKEQYLFALDAPVSGGDIGAQNGTLTIMVGGEETAFREMKPIFEVLGKNIEYQGLAGAGQHTKMCNQITIASNMVGVCEALIYAKKSGLQLHNVLKSISSGAAGSWSLSNLAPRITEGDFEPGFYVKHFIKDMGIALEEAERMGIDTPGLQLAKKRYDQLLNMGEGEKGTQALYKLYERESM
ncbi:NAD(P)-dependent oxidoreductase [Salirhabdus salicampi]|uniref:NAD(P)-dependent oxidoreductase n=1 Tax=Salirhabdus salicampi TaxID=476102 RepID=UPI0020C1D4AC|nr:NAD(P)-dependent oxidoreductase [Salirhabdus salicampi]MCP8617896.1 NAD(P)-dependent oxidoreductase [Salirhabdus salicampi]